MNAVIGLLAVCVLMILGLGYLWNLPSSESWTLLIGISFHAFVLSGIYASSFHFYIDRSKWSGEVVGIESSNNG